MTNPLPVEARQALAEKIRARRDVVAERVTNEFFLRHPDWEVRYGERGRKLGIEDACFHIDFIAAAIDSGAVESLVDYARWTARMLGARNIAPQFLVENLEQIKHALSGHLRADEHETVARYLRAACEGCLGPLASEVAGMPEGGLCQAQRLYQQAALTGQRRAALGIVKEAFREGHSIVDIYVEVLQETLYAVGRLWESNEITVAEEHMATAITQYVVAQMYPTLAPPETRRGRLVLAGVQGELHQVGGNMVADILESDGWDIRYLGTNMPHEGILKAIADHEADAVGFSATMLFNLPHVVKLIEAVRHRYGDAPFVVLGGSAFRTSPDLYREIGANAFAGDLRTAVDVMRGPGNE